MTSMFFSVTLQRYKHKDKQLFYIFVLRNFERNVCMYILGHLIFNVLLLRHYYILAISSICYNA